MKMIINQKLIKNQLINYLRMITIKAICICKKFQVKCFFASNRLFSQKNITFASNQKFARNYTRGPTTNKINPEIQN